MGRRGALARGLGGRDASRQVGGDLVEDRFGRPDGIGARDQVHLRDDDQVDAAVGRDLANLGLERGKRGLGVDLGP